MTRRKLALTLLTGAMIAVCAPSMANAQGSDTITGKYCEKFIHLTEASKRDNPDCDSPAFIREKDGVCVKETEAEDYLQLQLNEDRSLDFAFSLWYPPHTHYCSIIGTAQPSQGGWTYQENIAADSSAERCILTFKEEDGIIKIANDIDARCKTMCGFHTNLGFLNVPKSLKKSDTPDEKAFDYSYYMDLPENGGPTCDEAAKKYPEETIIEKYIPGRP